MDASCQTIERCDVTTQFSGRAWSPDDLVAARAGLRAFFADAAPVMERAVCAAPRLFELETLFPRGPTGEIIQMDSRERTAAWTELHGRHAVHSLPD